MKKGMEDPKGDEDEINAIKMKIKEDEVMLLEIMKSTKLLSTNHSFSLFINFSVLNESSSFVLSIILSTNPSD